jgi:hypothetical protein
MQNEFQDLCHQGNYKDALPVAFEVKGIVSSHFGEDHPVFASSLNNLGFVHKVSA